MKIRILTDIDFRWELLVEGEVTDLNTLDLAVEAITPTHSKEQIDFTVDGNAILFTYKPKYVGQYILSVFVNRFKDGESALDVKAFEGVRYTFDQDNDTVADHDMSKQYIEMTGNLSRSVDLSDYYTKEEISDLLKNISIDDIDTLLQEFVKSEELEQYAKKTDIPSLDNYVKKNDLSTYAKKSDIPSLSGYIKATEVDAKLEDYAKKTDIPDTSSFLTEHQPLKTINGQSLVGEGDIVIQGGGEGGTVDLSGYAKKTDVEAVQSDLNTTKGNMLIIQSNLTDAQANLASTQFVMVQSINTIKSDVDGIKEDYVTSTDLDEFAKKTDIPDTSSFLTEHQPIKTINGESIVGEGDIEIKAGIDEESLSEYAKKSEIPDVSGFMTASQVTDTLDDYPTFSELDSTLSDYAKQTDIPDVSEFITENDLPDYSDVYQPKGDYLTEHQSLEDYAKKSDIPDVSRFITEQYNGNIILEGSSENGDYMRVQNKKVWDMLESNEYHGGYLIQVISAGNVKSSPIVDWYKSSNRYILTVEYYDGSTQQLYYNKVSLWENSASLSSYNAITLQKQIVEGDNVTIENKNKISVKLKTINGESISGTGDIKIDTSDFATEEYVDNAVSAIDMTIFRMVQELPVENIDTNKIYLTPSSETGESNIYTEWAYVDNKWEKVGEYKSDVDLSDYITTGDLSDELADYATKSEVSGNIDALDGKIEETQQVLVQSINTIKGSVDSISSSIEDLRNGVEMPYMRLEIMRGTNTNITIPDSFDAVFDAIVNYKPYRLEFYESEHYGSSIIPEVVSARETSDAKGISVVVVSNYLRGVRYQIELYSKKPAIQKYNYYSTSITMPTSIQSEFAKYAKLTDLNSYSTKTYVDDKFSSVTQVEGDVLKVELTQAEYDALTVKNPNTIYVISDTDTGYYSKSEIDSLVAELKSLGINIQWNPRA